jgi:hypothetical protein
MNPLTHFKKKQTPTTARHTGADRRRHVDSRAGACNALVRSHNHQPVSACPGGLLHIRLAQLDV